MDTNTENKREVSHEVKRLGGASKTASEAFVNIFIIIMNQEEGGRLDASPLPARACPWMFDEISALFPSCSFSFRARNMPRGHRILYERRKASAHNAWYCSCAQTIR